MKSIASSKESHAHQAEGRDALFCDSLYDLDLRDILPVKFIASADCQSAAVGCTDISGSSIGILSQDERSEAHYRCIFRSRESLKTLHVDPSGSLVMAIFSNAPNQLSTIALFQPKQITSDPFLLRGSWSKRVKEQCEVVASVLPSGLGFICGIGSEIDLMRFKAPYSLGAGAEKSGTARTASTVRDIKVWSEHGSAVYFVVQSEREIELWAFDKSTGARSWLGASYRQQLVTSYSSEESIEGIMISPSVGLLALRLQSGALDLLSLDEISGFSKTHSVQLGQPATCGSFVPGTRRAFVGLSSGSVESVAFTAQGAVNQIGSYELQDNRREISSICLSNSNQVFIGTRESSTNGLLGDAPSARIRVLRDVVCVSDKAAAG